MNTPENIDDVRRKLEAGSKYDPETGCTVWQGAPKGSGYGTVYIGRDGEGILRSLAVHRAAYIIHKGEIPRGRQVLQTCGNKLCINPDHLSAPGDGGPQLNIEAVYVSVCRLGHCARAVAVAGDLGLEASRETLESLETLLENPDHFKPLVKSGKKYYQAI